MHDAVNDIAALLDGAVKKNLAIAASVLAQNSCIETAIKSAFITQSGPACEKVSGAAHEVCAGASGA